MQKTYPTLLTGVVVGRTRTASPLLLLLLLLFAPWLLEAGKEEEGRRGKSLHAALSADAALFRRMEGVGGFSGEENPAECLENRT